MRLALLLVLAAAGCNGKSGDPCAGLGCAEFIGSLTLHVVSARDGLLVDQPTFSEAGRAVVFECSGRLADGGLPDGGAAPCSAWQVFWNGHHEVVVAAAGHAPQTVVVDIKGPAGCCGHGEEIDRTVTLQP